jgi:hypothetical protein
MPSRTSQWKKLKSIKPNIEILRIVAHRYKKINIGLKFWKNFKRYFVDQAFNWIDQKTQRAYNRGVNSKYLTYFTLYIQYCSHTLQWVNNLPCQRVQEWEMLVEVFSWKCGKCASPSKGVYLTSLEGIDITITTH